MTAKKKKFYVCSTAWDHEVGQTDVLFFTSKKALQQAMDCSNNECGIVEVTGKLIKPPRRSKARTSNEN